MEEQLKLYQEGEIWEDVSEIFAKGYDESGNLDFDSDLVRILREAAGYNTMSDTEKE
jgi:hypothetical protein